MGREHKDPDTGERTSCQGGDEDTCQDKSHTADLEGAWARLGQKEKESQEKEWGWR